MNMVHVLSLIGALVGGVVFSFALMHWQTLKGLTEQRLSRINL